MLTCCRRKHSDDRERILSETTDYWSFALNDVPPLQSDWSAGSDSTPVTSNITTLDTVQPKVKESVSLRRTPFTTSTEEWYKDSPRTSDHTEPVCSPGTVAVDMSSISDTIRDSFLFPYFIQEEDVFSTEDFQSSHTQPSHGRLATVHFSLVRIPVSSGFAMKMELKAMRDLPYKGRGLLYDPMAVIALLPGPHQKKMSAPAFRNLNPSFKDTFVFCWNFREHTSPSLRITVYDAARRKKHMEIGHVILPDVQSLVSYGNPIDCQLVLGKSSVIHNPVGEIFITLSYSSKHKRLTVGLLRVRNVSVPSTINRKVNKDLRAKVTLLFAGDKVHTKRTDSICLAPSTFINQSFEFFVPGNLLDEVSIVTSLGISGFLSPSILIGRAVIGPYTRTGESAMNFWGLVVQSERAIKRWYTLRL